MRNRISPSSNHLFLFKMKTKCAINEFHPIEQSKFYRSSGRSCFSQPSNEFPDQQIIYLFLFNFVLFLDAGHDLAHVRLQDQSTHHHLVQDEADLKVIKHFLIIKKFVVPPPHYLSRVKNQLLKTQFFREGIASHQVNLMLLMASNFAFFKTSLPNLFREKAFNYNNLVTKESGCRSQAV